MRINRSLHAVPDRIQIQLKDEVGLYRDDGLAVCKATPKEIERTKKDVSNVFKSNGSLS